MGFVAGVVITPVSGLVIVRVNYIKIIESTLKAAL